MQGLYELNEGSLDVVVLGSSHAFVNINPMVLFKEYGITAYDACGGNAPMWNSYYNLVEVLKYQTPKVVVLEGYGLVNDYEYISHEGVISPAMIAYNVFGLRPSLNKLEDIRASVPKEDLENNILEYKQYHSRYANLNRDDFLGDYSQSQSFDGGMGHVVYTEAVPQTPFVIEKPNNNETTTDLQSTVIPAKQKKYYEKIIELCKEKNIQLFVFIAPYSYYSNEHDAIFTEAAGIAAANGVGFINGNYLYDEIGIDWEKDFEDQSHMNYVGNEKLSKYLGDALIKFYGVENHLADNSTKYDDWKNAVRVYDNRSFGWSLKSKLYYEMNEYIDEINKLPEDFDVYFYIGGELKANADYVVDYLNICGIPSDKAYPDYVWLKNGTKVTPYEKNKLGFICSNEYGKSELVIDDSGIWWNAENIKRVDDGVCIVVIDKCTYSVVDSAGICNIGVEEDYYGLTHEREE